MLGVCALVAGVTCTTRAVTPLLEDIGRERGYRRLAHDVSRREGDRDGAAREIDWSNHALDPAAAWVRVGGTGIDYPVAQATRDDPDFYLSHDLNGKPDRAGCAYLDERCETSDPHRLVFGHHMATTGGMFFPIADAWEQSRFDALGACLWSTRERDATLRPICSLRRDLGFANIQRFDFANEDDLRSWLAGIVGEADAGSPDAERLVSVTAGVVTLVTCTSGTMGMPERTMALFAETTGS